LIGVYRVILIGVYGGIVLVYKPDRV